MKAYRAWFCLLLFLAGCSSHNSHSKVDLLQQNDKVLYDLGMKRLADKNYLKARENFKLVFDNFPKSDYRILAKLAYADSYYQDGGDSNMLLAIQEYQDFISLFPFSPKAEYAQVQIGMSYFQMHERPDRDQSNTKKAEEEFRKAIDNYPNGQYYQAATEHLVECYKLLAQHEYMIALYYKHTGRPAAAVDRLKGMMKAYPESVYLPEHFLLLGQCLEDLSQNNEACTYFKKIEEKWPKSEYSGKATKGAARTCKS